MGGHDKNREAEPRHFCDVREKVLFIEYVPGLYCSRDAFKFNALISIVWCLDVGLNNPTENSVAYIG